MFRLKKLSRPLLLLNDTKMLRDNKAGAREEDENPARGAQG
jgi:hypothetical protein